MLTFQSFVMAVSISRQDFSFLSHSTNSGRFASIVRSVINGIYRLIVPPLSFMTHSGIIIIIITFMQYTYTSMPETNHVSRVYSVTDVLYLQFMVHVNVISHVECFVLLH